MQPVQSQVIEGLWRRSHKRSEQTQGAQYPSDDRGSCAFLDGLNHHTRLGKMCSWVAHHHRERQDCTYHRRSTYAVDRPRVEQFAVNHQRARSTQQSGQERKRVIKVSTQKTSSSRSTQSSHAITKTFYDSRHMLVLLTAKRKSEPLQKTPPTPNPLYTNELERSSKKKRAKILITQTEGFMLQNTEKSSPRPREHIKDH